MSTPSYTVTHDSITIILKGETYTIRRGSKYFEEARRAVLEERWDMLPGLLTPGLAILKWLGGEWTFTDHHICYKGERVDFRLNDRMLRMAAEGADPRR